MENIAKNLVPLFDNINKVIHGKEKQIQLIIAAWLSDGHVLIEDVPGTGKTVLAKTIAKSVDINFGRVQFTTDLLPSDIIGTTIYDDEKKKLLFRKGPIFSTFFLGDEINRATPRTQSALLECMAERQVTIENTTTQLHKLFFVMATQNPIEQHGTFPLPEAQLDRFSIKISLGYPNREMEVLMAKNRYQINPLDQIEAVISSEEIVKIKESLNQIAIHESVYQYTMDIIEATRKHTDLKLGASPRATLILLKMAQALAYINGDDYVRATNVYQLCNPVLTHRILLTPEAKFAGKSSTNVIKDILLKIKAPIK
jgi:MoxR-like ATPase